MLYAVLDWTYLDEEQESEDVYGAGCCCPVVFASTSINGFDEDEV
jgi:hypothetical protein